VYLAAGPGKDGVEFGLGGDLLDHGSWLLLFVLESTPARQMAELSVSCRLPSKDTGTLKITWKN